MRETDPRSISGKLPAPDRHVPLVVVGAGAAGVAAAIEAARAGVEVALIDEHPVDNDMMAMDVPLCFGQRMDGSVRNRALMLERVVETNPDLAAAHEAGVDVQLGTYVWGAFVNGPAVQELPVPMLGLADDRRSWLLGYDRLIVAAGARDVLLGFPGWERAGSARRRRGRRAAHAISSACRVPHPRARLGRARLANSERRARARHRGRRHRRGRRAGARRRGDGEDPGRPRRAVLRVAHHSGGARAHG